jgi:hypothetical protein
MKSCSNELKIMASILFYLSDVVISDYVNSVSLYVNDGKSSVVGDNAVGIR